MVLSIAWFITSIETTIRWNSIQGVHSIDSTGQLIPFIIGCVSASQVLKKVILLALGKVRSIFFFPLGSCRRYPPSVLDKQAKQDRPTEVPRLGRYKPRDPG